MQMDCDTGIMDEQINLIAIMSQQLRLLNWAIISPPLIYLLGSFMQDTFKVSSVCNCTKQIKTSDSQLFALSVIFLCGGYFEPIRV